MNRRANGDADAQRLRAELHRLVETVEPAPDYLGRLRRRRRSARRRRVAELAGAACLVAALGITAIVVVPRASRPVTPSLPAGLPRTLLALAVESAPPSSGGRTIARPLRSGREAFVRLDTATGRLVSVLHVQRSIALWTLRDDGSVVAQTGSAACSFELTAWQPDGRQLSLGRVPGFQGNTGSSIATIGFSPDGRLLAVAGTTCPDRNGFLHSRVAVFRVGRTVDRHPLYSANVPDLSEPPYYNLVGAPSFSADGRQVVYPVEAGQGGFDPQHGVFGSVFTGWFQVDLSRPADQPVARRVRSSGTGCLVVPYAMRMGPSPAELVAVEGCAGRQLLVEMDLISARARPVLTLPNQPSLSALDYDTTRSHLLLAGSSRNSGGITLSAWDGTGSLRPLVRVQRLTIEGASFDVRNVQW
jgi:hypothetical protein